MAETQNRPGAVSATRPAPSPSRSPKSNRIDHQRRISEALDELLGVERASPGDSCNGHHHPGQRHDWWGVCSGMSLDFVAREYAGRALARSGWTP